MREKLFKALDEEIYATTQKLEGLQEAREKLKDINEGDLITAAYLIKWYHEDYQGASK